MSLSHFRNSGDINPKHIISITESFLLDAFRKARAAFKIVAASLAARGPFKIVAFFLYKVIQKFVCRNIFATFDFPCMKNLQLLRDLLILSGWLSSLFDI